MIDLLGKRMVRKIRAKQVGLPPGSLVHVGEVKTERPIIDRIVYDEINFEHRDDISLEESLEQPGGKGVQWLNVCGLHDIDMLRTLGDGFNIHPLALEDILNTTHRPKIEVYDTYLLVILKMITFDDEHGITESEQISCVLGEGFLISFQERTGDVFNAVRERLRKANGRIRSRGADYLLYALIDSLVDHYFHVMENLDERFAEYEHELLQEQTIPEMNRIHLFSKEVLQLRRAVWPMRDMVSELQNDESGLVHESSLLFLRDLHDHVIQAIENVEIFRDTTTSLINLRMSLSGNRMNEIMKVLTIMASIFIPLTFIAGIYGMNFEWMPELRLHWGYPAVLLLMLACVVVMLIYFKRKRWL